MSGDRTAQFTFVPNGTGSVHDTAQAESTAPDHSCLSAAIGSMRDAFLAGTYPAKPAAPSRIAPATARVNGSLAFIPNRKDATNLVVPSAAASPIASPTAASAST